MGRRPPGEKLRFSKFLYVGDFVDGAMPSLAFYRIFVITPSQTSLRVAIPNIRYIPAGCRTSSAKSLACQTFTEPLWLTAATQAFGMAFYLNTPIVGKLGRL